MRIKKGEIEPGSLLMRSWGATMRGVDFYQVIEIKGSRVLLGTPKTETEGNQAGHTWIKAKSENPSVTAFAKFTQCGLKLCEGPGKIDWKGRDVSWNVSDCYWDYLQHAKVGEKEHFYGD